jgi:hypothetical protein
MLTEAALLLRIEGAALLTISLLAYHAMQFHWLIFAVLLLVPDISMIGYLANVKTGAATYNLVHTMAGPFVLFTYSIVTMRPHPASLRPHLERAHRHGPHARLRPEIPHPIQRHPPPARLIVLRSATAVAVPVAVAIPVDVAVPGNANLQIGGFSPGAPALMSPITSSNVPTWHC